MEPQDLQKFLAELRDGNAEAWERLIKEFDEPMRRYVRALIQGSVVQGEERPSDIVQNVWFRLQRRLQRELLTCESVPEFRRYLLTMALNEFRNAIRRNPRGKIELGDQDFMGKDSSPSAKVHKQEEKSRDQAILDRIKGLLTPEDRQVFIWKNEEGLQWAEILAYLGLNPHLLHSFRTRYNNHVRRAIITVREDLGLEPRGENS